jgi:predicted membrane chloride channel (bestrophin family)
MGNIVVAVVAFEGVVVPKVVHRVVVLHVVLLVVVVHLVLQAPFGLHFQRFVLEGCSEAAELGYRCLDFC